MAILEGLYGVVYDDSEPLYVTSIEGFTFNRVSRQIVQHDSLLAQAILLSHTITAAEVGDASDAWKAANYAGLTWGIYTP